MKNPNFEDGVKKEESILRKLLLQPSAQNINTTNNVKINENFTNNSEETKIKSKIKIVKIKRK